MNETQTDDRREHFESVRDSLEVLEEKLATARYEADRAEHTLAEIDKRLRRLALDAINTDPDALEEYAALEVLEHKRVFGVSDKPRSEEPFEFGHDDAFDVPADVGKRAEDMHSGGWPRISESYVAGKVELHLHFRLSEVEVADYCVVL